MNGAISGLEAFCVSTLYTDQIKSWLVRCKQFGNRVLIMQPRQQCRRRRTNPALLSQAREGRSGRPRIQGHCLAAGPRQAPRPVYILLISFQFTEGEMGWKILLAISPVDMTHGSSAEMLHVTRKSHNIPLPPSWHFRQDLFLFCLFGFF